MHDSKSDPKIMFRGRYYNRPKLRAEWSREQCFMAGYLKALKAFQVDIRKGGERSARQVASEIKWSDQ